MTGREKILAAFSLEGTPEFGAAVSYDSIFIRDHWHTLTDVPWWHAFSGAVAEEAAWAKDCLGKSGLEWLNVRPCPSRAERARQRYERRGDAIWIVDGATGEARKLQPPTPSGVNTPAARSKHMEPKALPSSRKEVEALVPLAPEFDREAFLAEGRHDAAAAIRQACDVLLYGQFDSPLWSLYGLVGYEGMMLLLGQSPGLSAFAGQRLLQNAIQRVRMVSALGADAVWIEECLTDQISPRLFREINTPLVRRCVEEIRACGMRSIYYYCGNPHDRMEAILEVGADAVHFEESKKGFSIDIEDIAAKTAGRCVLFGNLDSVGILRNAPEDVFRREIERQMEAGRRNGNRFVLSTGSPVTPDTPVERVRLYTDMARDLN